MPQINIKLPSHVLTPAVRAGLATLVTEAASDAEQIPQRPENRFFCWLVIDAVEAGSWTCGGQAPVGPLLPCFVHAMVPKGVLDDESRARYVKRLHQAIVKGLGTEVARGLATSIIVQDIEDGTWGANGAVMRLPEFVKKVGFTHLQ